MKLDFLGRDLTSKDLLLLHYIISGKKEKKIYKLTKTWIFLHQQQNCVRIFFQKNNDRNLKLVSKTNFIEITKRIWVVEKIKFIYQIWIHTYEPKYLLLTWKSQIQEPKLLKAGRKRHYILKVEIQFLWT